MKTLKKILSVSLIIIAVFIVGYLLYSVKAVL